MSAGTQTPNIRKSPLTRGFERLAEHPRAPEFVGRVASGLARIDEDVDAGSIRHRAAANAMLESARERRQEQSLKTRASLEANTPSLAQIIYGEKPHTKD